MMKKIRYYMQPGSQVEIRPQRDIIINKYAFDNEDQATKIVGQDLLTIPDRIPTISGAPFPEVIVGTLVARKTWGREIKKNRWEYGSEWIVTFNDDPHQQYRYFQSDEITLIPS